MTILSLINSVPAAVRKIEVSTIPVGFLALGAAFFQPLIDAMIILIFLLFGDMFISIYAQVKHKNQILKRKGLEKPEYLRKKYKTIWCIIDPDKLLNTVEKIFGYVIALFVCYLGDYYIFRIGVSINGFFHILSITNAVYVLMLIREIISILRNLGKITNNSIFDQIIKILTQKSNTEINLNDHDNHDKINPK